MMRDLALTCPIITVCPAAKQDTQPLFSDEFWERMQNGGSKVVQG